MVSKSFPKFFIRPYWTVRSGEKTASMNRIETLKGFLKDNPNDSFLRYALALEYIKLGQNDEAVREFEAVRNTDPEYVATYYQLGQLYQKLGQKHDAEKTFRTGITVATKAGDEHTRSELEAALEGLLSVE